MMTLTLPEKEPQIKIPLADLANSDLDLHCSGSIVFRFTLSGKIDVEIIADGSDEEDILRQRLSMARPVLQVLQKMFTLYQFTNQEIR